jgi:hypothetical protein
MIDGNLTNTTVYNTTKYAGGGTGGADRFDIVVRTDVTPPTNARAVGADPTINSRIQATVFKYGGMALATQDMTPLAGATYEATVRVDSGLTTGEWFYAVAAANWVVDASDSETSPPKKAPA